MYVSRPKNRSLLCHPLLLPGGNLRIYIVLRLRGNPCTMSFGSFNPEIWKAPASSAQPPPSSQKDLLQRLHYLSSRWRRRVAFSLVAILPASRGRAASHVLSPHCSYARPTNPWRQLASPQVGEFRIWSTHTRRRRRYWHCHPPWPRPHPTPHPHSMGYRNALQGQTILEILELLDAPHAKVLALEAATYTGTRQRSMGEVCTCKSRSTGKFCGADRNYLVVYEFLGGLHYHVAMNMRAAPRLPTPEVLGKELTFSSGSW